MAQFVKPFLETLLDIPDIQDCGMRCQDLFISSPLGTSDFVIAQANGIKLSNSKIAEARQYEMKNSHTVPASEADKYRDRRYSIFLDRVNSNAKLVEDEPEMAESSARIKEITKKHCTGLSKMNRTDETVALKGLFAELDLSENQDHIGNAEVERYYLKLKDAQDQYDQAESAKLSEAVAKGEYIRPVESAAEIVYRLEALFSYLDALVLDNPVQYKELLDSVNKVIDSVMIPARANQTRKNGDAS